MLPSFVQDSRRHSRSELKCQHTWASAVHQTPQEIAARLHICGYFLSCVSPTWSKHLPKQSTHFFIYSFMHSFIHSLIHALTPANKSVLPGTGAQSPEPNLPVRDPVIAEGTTHQHTPWQPALQSVPAPCPPPHYLYASSPLPVRKG